MLWLDFSGSGAEKMTAALPDAKKIKGPEAPAGRSPGLALELLVHGVGGATPAGMLQDPRTVCLQGDDTAGIHRRAHDADAEQRPGDYQGKTVPEAYCWANLTSGDASRALWLLLLPFMVINLAHWMRPPAAAARRRLNYAYDLVIRLTALSLTALLVAAAAEVALDLLAWQCAGTTGCASGKAWLSFLSVDGAGWWSRPGRRLAVAAAVPAALAGLLWWLSHRTWIAYESQRPLLTGPGRGPGSLAASGNAAGGEDAAGPPSLSPPLSLPGFWYGRRLVSRLRAAHTAVAFLTVAAALVVPALQVDRAAGREPLAALGWALCVVAALLAAAALVVVERSCRSEEQPDEAVDRLAVRALPGCALGLTALAAVYAGWERDGWRSTGRLPGTGAFTALTTAQVALVALLVALAGLMHRGRPAPGAKAALFGLAGPATAMLACVLGGVFSGGVAQRAADWLDRGATPGARGAPLAGPPVLLSWQAAVIPPVAVVLVIVGAVGGVRLWRNRKALLRQVRGSHPGEVEQPARSRQIAQSMAVARLTDAVPALLGTVALTVLTLTSSAVAGAWLTQRVPGEAARPAPAALSWAAEVAQALGSWMVGGAAMLLLALGRRAYSRASARRSIGILWDVGTFWPRAAHPFAPPCYAERAVPDLAWRMATWVERVGGKLVLSGHSQGSVLAAAAAWQLDQASRARVGLLTYGSPLERLYGRYFPAYFGPAALGSLHGELHAWRNLWRRTDPIGGPVRLPGVDADPLRDPAAYGRTADHPLPAPIRGHSGYRDDPAFSVARAALLEQLLPAATSDQSSGGKSPG